MGANFSCADILDLVNLANMKNLISTRAFVAAAFTLIGPILTAQAAEVCHSDLRILTANAQSGSSQISFRFSRPVGMGGLAIVDHNTAVATILLNALNGSKTQICVDGAVGDTYLDSITRVSIQ